MDWAPKVPARVFTPIGLLLLHLELVGTGSRRMIVSDWYLSKA
jgi:hypothetical protein